MDENASLKNLQGLTGLKVLRVVSTPVTGSGFKYVADLPSLITVHIEYSKVNDAGWLNLPSSRACKLLDRSTLRLPMRGFST